MNAAIERGGHRRSDEEAAHLPRVRLTAATLVTLLLAPALVGCFDREGEPLAQPTNKPPSPPSSRPTPTTPTTTFNLTDPGYAMTGAWRIGDGWDWESNLSHYRRVRVIDQRLVGGATFYYLEEKTGDVGEPAKKVTTMWVEGATWSLLNATDDTRGVDRYHPGLPLRFFRNATLAYNHTRTEGSGRVSANETAIVQVRLFGPHQSILLSWGYVEARKVEESKTIRGGSAPAQITKRWVHADYLNDVQYELSTGELFKLKAAKAGDFRRGQLVQ